MFNGRVALWLPVNGRVPSGCLSIGGGFWLVVDGEEILGLAPNGGTLLLTMDRRRISILRMARTGHLRRNIDWGACSLPDALDQQQGQRTALFYGWGGHRSHGRRCLKKRIIGQCF